MISVEEIKEYLKRNKISYADLSKKSNIPENTLKQIFRGRTQNPRIDTMKAIINALELETQKKPAGDFPVSLEQFKQGAIDRNLLDKMDNLTPEQLKIVINALNGIVDSFKKN